MAIHAGLRNEGVFINGLCAERGQFPLVDAHFAVDFIPRCNMAVNQSVIYGPVAHVNYKWTVSVPLLPFQAAYRYPEAIPGILFQQLFPPVLWKTDHLFPGTFYCASVCSFHRGFQAAKCILPPAKGHRLFHGEVQRSDVHRHGHFPVIGPDHRPGILNDFFSAVMAAGKYGDQGRKNQAIS